MNWMSVRRDWLDSRRSPNTRRSYEYALQAFLQAVGKPPGEATRADAMAWMREMERRGLTRTTIVQRLAAVSSFYEFAASMGLDLGNPVRGLSEKVAPYGNAVFLNVEQVRAILRSPDRRTVRGKRDYALLLFFIATGRRNSEVRRLRWGDFDEVGGRVFYHWSGKGKERRDELPRVVWEAILDYLRAAGRMPMEDGDFIFTALSDVATRLPTVREWDGNRPLSAQQVGKIVKRHARLAGLDERNIHPHTLRHTAAMLRREVGDDVLIISKFLAHSSLDTTRIYLDHIGRFDASWQRVADLLNLAS